ncbi:MAG TPA: rod shape-determining protein MreD [Myxococcota bacterium]|jgi:rod shape-determining protein MreD|nr:rod shape-determining protein MreD [Myxococcota bacterium]
MRPLAVLALLGLAAVVLQGALAALLPPALVPDLGLLLTVAAAVEAPVVGALLLAAGLGYGADVLSGTLLGQFALLRLLAFAATRVVHAQFHLERGLPLASFCFALSLLDAVGLAAIANLFAGASPLGLDALPSVLGRALLNAALAPPLHRLVSGLLATLQEGDARRREVRFDTRRRPVI